MPKLCMPSIPTKVPTPPVEELHFSNLIWDINDLSDSEFRSVVKQLMEHLKLSMIRTNQHGPVEIVLVKEDEE